jgi:hypothetical protein
MKLDIILHPLPELAGNRLPTRLSLYLFVSKFVESIMYK